MVSLIKKIFKLDLLLVLLSALSLIVISFIAYEAFIAMGLTLCLRILLALAFIAPYAALMEAVSEHDYDQ